MFKGEGHKPRESSDKRSAITYKTGGFLNSSVGPCGSEVERQSLASVLSPSCAQPVADG